jgi:hypothetical protein
MYTIICVEWGRKLWKPSEAFSMGSLNIHASPQHTTPHFNMWEGGEREEESGSKRDNIPQ